MTTLETLKVEAREKILGVAVNRQSSLYDVEVLADEITSKVFEAALQEALGKLHASREMNGYGKYEDEALAKAYMHGQLHVITETIQGIESLIPKKDI